MSTHLTTKLLKHYWVAQALERDLGDPDNPNSIMSFKSAIAITINLLNYLKLFWDYPTIEKAAQYLEENFDISAILANCEKASHR